MADNSSGGDALVDSYALSSELLTDGEPVRCVSSIPSRSEILSGSQGGVVSRLALGGGPSPDGAGGGGPALQVQPGGPGTRHPHQIGAILSSSPPPGGGRDPLGVYATGCRDGAVRVMDARTHELRYTLEGHSNAVTSLSWVAPSGGGADEAPWLVSGSWDGTARVWRIPPASSSPSARGFCLGTIGGHENTVSVAGLPCPDGGPSVRGVVTTSAGVASGNAIAGHAVRVWRLTESPDGMSVEHELVNKVGDDHAGPIRDVAYDPDTDAVYTCSNDGTVKVRSAATGVCSATLACPGADRPMLLSVCVVGDPASKAVVAGTEDGNVVVWDVSGANRDVQTVGHPGCVWRVSPVGPGDSDFISACNDGHIRIFTRVASRFASSEAIANFDRAVTESKASRSTGPSPEEIAKLPQWEMNALTRGRSEGQVQVFNKSGVAIAAQWSESSGTWIEVGEVTGTNENAGTLDGTRYDHVFDVEVEVPSGGVRKLKIGYNNGENPFVVAQKFIDDNMLSQGDLAQIADYIRQRAGASAPTLGMDAGGGASSAGYAAPPSSSGPAPMDASPTYDHIPMRGYKTFDSGADSKGLAKVVSKVRELNASSSSPLPPSLADDALDSLASVLAVTNRYHSSSVPDGGLEAIRRMVSDWDAKSAFPALDLARIAVLHPDASSSGRRGYWDDVLSSALGQCESLGPDGCRSEVAVPMLTMRLLANSYKGGPGSSSSAGSLSERALGCVSLCSESSNKNVRLGAATALLNASSYMASSGPGSGATAAAAGKAVEVSASMLRSGRYEAEATVRALVAMGTAMLAPGEAGAAAKRTAREIGAGEAAERGASAAGVGIAAAVAGDIRSVLS